ncbi:hypothetical protein [Enterobacter asburiae]|uniref:hypothetical protein n=1 Tax=Enterobacter asburiae TaxID=61645 RepID=UPI0018C2289B|nr:hypothetical protein [Enterobacter asburiae]MBF9773453.1 hypothetical protein [Enterobacter asburiae]
MGISHKKIVKVIGFYGFIECGQILNFLLSVCNERLERIDLLWIYSKIDNCLRAHGNNSEYFDALIELRSDIEMNIIINEQESIVIPKGCTGPKIHLTDANSFKANKPSRLNHKG